MSYSRYGTDYEMLTKKFTDGDWSKAEKKIETGIVIVGAGISGLAAGVEAVNRGIPTVMLEHRRVVGGSGSTTLGILAVGSHFQKEQGIEISTGEVIGMEQENFSYRVNGARLRDMIFASAENLHWLEANGVRFSGRVDRYMSDGHVPTMHWWAGNSGQSYVLPMRDKFVENGGTLLLETDAKKLITDKEGRVRGLYAIEMQTNSVLEIRANAVILANGGFEQNQKLLRSRGYTPEDLSFMGASGHDGSGHFMAWAAGAGNTMEITSLLEIPYNKHLPGIAMRGYAQLWLGMQGRQLMVNSLGERFMDESASEKQRAFPQLAIQNQKPYRCFEIYDQRIMDAAIEHARQHSPSWKKSATVIQEALENGAEGVYKVNSIEEAAEKAGIEKERLLKTFADYQRYCRQGRDEEFGKNPERLWELSAPFYCMQYTEPNFITTLGGVHTGRNSEALGPDHRPIPGLYAVGTLGTELWPGYYTYGMPGGANAFNVDSGRRAVRDIVEKQTPLA